MGEWGLELTQTDSELLTGGIVEPSLLKQSTSTASGIDREVERHLPKGLACETQHSIGDGEARIGHVVLIIGLVQTLVIVVIELSSRLHQQVGLEYEITFLRLNRETFTASQ